MARRMEIGFESTDSDGLLEQQPPKHFGSRAAVLAVGTLAFCGTAAALWQNPQILKQVRNGAVVGLSESDLPKPYKLKKGTCSKDSFTGGGEKCSAPWVYCTDANCDPDLVESTYTPGMLVARCECWMPENTEFSIIPKETAGAGCVADEITGKAPFGVTGGSDMCDKMKNDKNVLVSTYGPTGKSDIHTKVEARALKCEARTPWAWCWGAPCKKENDQVICECPVVISDWNESQYVSMSQTACEAEKNLKDACGVIRNGSPAGESPMKTTKQCDVTDADAGRDESCRGLPFVHLTEVVSSNLGKAGPNTDAEEGLIYKATAQHTGLDIKNLQIHAHTLKTFDEDAKEEEKTFDDEYEPAFTKGTFQNGINGFFAQINVKPGENLKVRIHAYDADAKKDITMPHGAMSFFDLDAAKADGEDELSSVEHVKICDYHAYYLTDETEVEAKKDNATGCMVFSATKAGNGDDNPTDPLELTPLQKDRAVTVRFEDKSSFDFEIGASKGSHGRVFTFVLRPSLLCAKTKMPNGALLPAKGKGAPLEPIEHKRSGAYHQLPSVVLFLSIVFYFS